MIFKTIVKIFMVLAFLSMSIIELQAHSWEAPKKEAQRKNPILLDSKSINEGRILFKEQCSDCHGDNAGGLKTKDSGLKKNTGNLKKRLKGHSDGDFFWKIQNGKGEMPSFMNDLSETQIWHIINFIKSLEVNKSKK